MSTPGKLCVNDTEQSASVQYGDVLVLFRSNLSRRSDGLGAARDHQPCTPGTRNGKPTWTLEPSLRRLTRP